MYDIVNDVKIVASQVAAVVGASAADGSKTTIDRSGFEAVAFDYNVGAEADSLSGSVKFDFKVEHADEDPNSPGNPGSYAPVDADDIVIPAWSTNMAYATGGIVLTVDAAADSPCVGSVGYVGGKRFVRSWADATGTTTGQPIAINCRLSKPHFSPILA